MNKVLFSLIGFFAVTSAYAVTGYDARGLLGVWGGGGFSKCGNHTINGVYAENCIGVYSVNCQRHPADFEPVPQDKDEVKDHVYQMMMAVDVNEKGAYFCPIQVETSTKNTGKSSLKYVQIGSSDRCRWLCKEGYSGDKCQDKADDVAFCDTAPFSRSDYTALNLVTSGADFSESIAQFENKANEHKLCKVGIREQEHNSVLMVTRWASGGYGAWVAPVIIRAQYAKEGNKRAWPAIYPRTGAEEQLVCVSGYRPNVGRTDCIQINSELCQRADLGCPDLDKSGYNDSIHVKIMPSVEKCPDFRCKDSNQAFVSTMDKTCVSCPRTLVSGVSPIDGTCVTCESGYAFNPRATVASQLCKTALRLTKTDMQYGFGYTKNSRPDVDEQCWSMMQIDEYRACVLANVPNATTGTITVSAPSVSQSASILTFETPSVTPSGNNPGDDETDDDETDGNTGGQQNPV
ncbi:MAG: hypothetical protein R8N50_01050 [Alphaproteobacteria bacterium]|nr:hypothetical protein [Alphaproteobacteria bacterium]